VFKGVSDIATNVKKKGRRPEFKPGSEVRSSPSLREESKLAAKRKSEELEDDLLTLYKKLPEKDKLEVVKELISSKKLKEQDGNEEPINARSAQAEVHPSSSRSISSPSKKRMVNLESAKNRKGQR
jgi:hypothetical protein